MATTVFAEAVRYQRNAAGIPQRPVVQVQPRAVAGMKLFDAGHGGLAGPSIEERPDCRR